MSKEQKAFNRWIKKIEGQRQRLQSWQAILPVYRTRCATELAPLERQYDEHRAAMVHLLDQICQGPGLTKAEKSKLPTIICSLARAALEGLDSPELIAVYDKYSDTRFEDEQRQATEAAKAMTEAMFGLDLGDEGDLATPEALMRRVEEKMREMHAAQAEDPPEAPAPERKPSAKTLAKQARLEHEAQQVSRSVRDVYRQLASALHPDREPDADERVRKTALMQRVNAAYDAKDLLQLLELQLQIEQIDQAAISQLEGPRLKHYNQVLATQSEELQWELEEIEMSFDGGDPFGMGLAIQPERLLRSLDHDIAELKANIEDIEHDLQEFRHPQHLKAWLRGVSIPRAARRPPKQPATAAAADDGTQPDLL